jgi:hypothetical protein
MRSVAIRTAGLPSNTLATYVDGALRTGGYWPNQFDNCLMHEYRAWNWLIAAGGLERLCLPLGQSPYIDRPWIKQPESGRAFSPIGISAVSAITEGVETPILSFETPFGYDGVINYAVAEIAPPAGGSTGYGEGSGQITWRLKANERHLRDWGDVLTSRGSLIDPSPIPNGGLRIYSRNLIQLTVTLSSPSGLTSNANLIASVMGWFYPR